MNVEGMDPGDVGVMLDVDYNIATRTGLHCAPLVHTQLGTVEGDGGVRFSIGAFNTEAEVDTAIAAMTEISRWARERASKIACCHGPRIACDLSRASRRNWLSRAAVMPVTAVFFAAQ